MGGIFYDEGAHEARYTLGIGNRGIGSVSGGLGGEGPPNEIVVGLVKRVR